MPMPKGRSGNPGGRKPGTKNTKTILRTAALAKILKDKNTPLEFMMAVMNNPKIPLALRLDSAKAAAPYVHSKMPVKIEHGGEVGHAHRGGVMIVPAPEGTTDWASRSAVAQEQLKKDVKT